MQSCFWLRKRQLHCLAYWFTQDQTLKRKPQQYDWTGIAVSFDAFFNPKWIASCHNVSLAEGGMNFRYAAGWIIHATAPSSLSLREWLLLWRRSFLRHVLIYISEPTIKRLQGRIQMRWALGGNQTALDGWIFNWEWCERSYIIYEKWKRVWEKEGGSIAMMHVGSCVWERGVRAGPSCRSSLKDGVSKGQLPAFFPSPQPVLLVRGVKPSAVSQCATFVWTCVFVLVAERLT